jgi:hypothetical protein
MWEWVYVSDMYTATLHIFPDEGDRADLWSIGLKSTLICLITWEDLITYIYLYTISCILESGMFDVHQFSMFEVSCATRIIIVHS